MFHQVQQAKPGFAALNGGQLTPVWFSSTVLLTALGFYMWPHTFGSALTAPDEDVFRRNAMFMPLYQLVIAFVLLVGFVAVLRLPGLAADSSDLALIGISQRAFPDWFVGLIGAAGMLCALVPGSMLLIVSATTVARNIYRGLNPSVSDRTVTTVTKLLVPVIALGAVAFVFAGGQTIVTLLLLGYALVTMTFTGATPGSSTTLDSLIGGLPGFLAQLNVGVVALVINVAVTAAVSMATRGSAPVGGRAADDGRPRFSREPAMERARQA
jgi:SSS family solute:Na+ symporter